MRGSRHEAAPEADVPKKSLAATARGVRFWTTNLIASGFILIVALVLGRELTDWWRPAEPLAKSRLPSSTARDAELEMVFGSSPQALRRRLSRGDATSAFTDLHAMCVEDASAFRYPTDQNATIGPQEQKLLARLADSQPAETLPNGIEMHHWEAGFPMVVAIAPNSVVMPPEQPMNRPDNISEMPRRVVTWGLAIPYGERAWHLLTFGTRPQGNSADVAGDASLNLPPGVEHVMTVRGADDSTVCVFRAIHMEADLLQHWSEFFDEQWGGKLGAWQKSSDRWVRHYSRQSPERSISVNLTRDRAEGIARGVVSVSPN